MFDIHLNAENILNPNCQCDLVRLGSSEDAFMENSSSYFKHHLDAVLWASSDTLLSVLFYIGILRERESTRLDDQISSY